MLVIREAQLAVFAESRWRDFQKRAFREITRCFASKVNQLGPQQSLQRVLRATTEARGHGFELEYDILRYVYLIFGLGSQFPLGYHWAVPVLQNPLFSAHTKADLLWQYGLEALGIIPPPEAEVEEEDEGDVADIADEFEEEQDGVFDGIVVSEDDEVIPEFEEAHEPAESTWSEMEIEDEPGADNSADDIR